MSMDMYRQEGTRGNPYLTISLVFLLVPPFFAQNIMTSNSMRMLFTALGLLFLLAFSVTNRRVIRIEGPAIVLLLFIVFIMLNNNYDIMRGRGYAWFFIIIAATFSMILLSAFPLKSWTSALLRIMTAFSLVYAFATIIIWLIPSLYDHVVYPLFFSNNHSEIVGRGYKSGLTHHYSTNGMYLALGLLASFGLYLQTIGRRRILSGMAFIVILFALVLTTKRAHLGFSLIAIVLAYLVMNIGSKRAMRRFFVFLCVALFAFLALSIFIPDLSEVLNRFQEAADDPTLNGRTTFYDLCLSMWNSSPLFGNGWGSYSIAFNNTPDSAHYVSQGIGSMDAHNVYLQVLAEEGIIGEIIFLLFVIGLFLSSIKQLRMLKPSDKDDDAEGRVKRGAAATSVAIQCFFILYCLTGNPLYVIMVFVPYLLACGISLSLIREGSVPITARIRTGVSHSSIE